MKEIDPPPPLDAGADTPEELRAVLRALGREGPGRGTLERVARELGPYMDAAPGLSLPVAQAARTGGKLLAARALAALLALGGTAYLVQRAWPSEPPPPVSNIPRTADMEPAVVEVAPVVEPAPAVELAPAVEAPVVRVRHHRARRERIFDHPLTVASTQEAVPETAPVAQTPEVPAKVEPVARVQEAPAAAEKPAEKAPEAKLDEYELLWQARQKIHRDPAASLALLDDHAARFANGQLAPEREVLAVEALRALGRTEDAEARLRRFRTRYPGSIHLRRLQKGQ